MATGFNHFQAIADALPQACGQIVRKTAQECRMNIQHFIVSNGQVLTGFMHDSVYSVTDEGSTYGQGHPQKGQGPLPEVGGANQTTAYVAVAAPYGIFQNYGTRFIPARPFFEPGIEATRPGFESECQALEQKLKDMVR